MTHGMIVAQIKGMEMRLAALKAAIKRSAQPAQPYCLGDLAGMLQGLSESTEEEINAVGYRMKRAEGKAHQEENL